MSTRTDGSTETEIENERDVSDVAALRARRLASADWASVTASLVEYARRHDWGADPSKTPEDYANAALAILRAPGYAEWDPRRQTLEERLGSLVNGLLRNAATAHASATRARPKKRKGRKDEEPPEARVAANQRSPEQLAAMRDLFEVVEERLLAKFGPRGVAFLLMADDTPDDQAEALGLTKREIYRLRENVRAFAEKLRVQLGVEESILARRPPDPELLALEAEIRALLPEAIRHERGPSRYSHGCLHVMLVALAIVVVFLAYMKLRGH